MKRNVALFVLLVNLMPSLAGAMVVADTHFNSLTEGGWSCFSAGANPEGGAAVSPSIVTAPGTAPDPANAMKVSFPINWHDGYNSIECDSKTYNSSEIYGQMYVYFPAGYQFHTTANKLSYTYLDSNNYTDNPGNFYVAVWGNKREVVIHLQPNGTPPNRVLYQNRANVTISTNTWYKISWYMNLNTSGSANGIARLWVNDVLQLEYTDVNMRAGSWGTRNFWFSTILPIWGGYNATNPTKDAADFFYIDRTIISTTPIGGGTGDGLQKNISQPNPPNNLIMK